MERFDRTLLGLLPLAFFATSCGTMRSTTASVDDDVYFMPSTAPVLAAADASAPLDEPEPVVTDDYYDPGTAQDLGTDRNYYDIVYNDPQFYNQGRFGFNTSMGWQNGWNGPGWGGGMGWGSGWNVGLGWGWGYGSGVYSGWYSPNWMWGNNWNSPWGWNNWGYGWGGGYGYGNYYGPWGNCYSCYTPVVIGDGGWSNTVVAPRSPLGSGGAGMVSGTRRMPVRNPVGLAPSPNDRTALTRNRAPEVDRVVKEPAKQPVRTRPAIPTRTRDESRPTRDVGRTAPGRGFDGGGGGGRTNPSPGTGGGGGGGTRTNPGRR
ncbi:MAG: hypothetical protein JNM62_06300 [Flavobacteriales bacterium]|nr:hypothetical protein [Flavobacteriales bacterium]